MDREQVIDLAREASIDWHAMWDDDSRNRLERFSALVAAAVKEEDAKICEHLGWGNNQDVNPRAGTTTAAAIRASIKP